MSKNLNALFLILLCASCAHTTPHGEATGVYPSSWWAPVQSEAPEWEIRPQAAKPGEVILSKRNELGLLSNFAPTPFTFEGVPYASMEGFWQMMKFPEAKDDPRWASQTPWPHTRKEVSQMVGFQAKRSGDAAEKIMKTLGIQWITYKGRRMDYKGKEQDLHFKVIKSAMTEKLKQNPRVLKVLLKTGNLKLKPDHHQKSTSPAAWRYHTIYMDLRQRARDGLL